MRLRRALIAGLAAALLAPAAAHAGTFSIAGSTLVYNADDGEIDDQIAGFDTGTAYRFTKFGEMGFGGGPGCRLSVTGESVDCDKDGVTLIVLGLEGGNDVAAVADSVKVPVRFEGGDGDDGLFGGGGLDTFLGGPGNDNVVSRDGRGEQVDCGAGLDTAISDDADSRTSCEEIEGDADADGVRRPADCDDANAAIRPGATDVPDDRIDQDCSGADATNLDVDGDGVPRPQDCDDSNPRIRPGAREVVGNRVDENCDTEAVPFRGLGGVIRTRWAPDGGRTVNVRMQARELPRGTRIRMTCSGRGCPFKAVSRRVRGSRPVNLHGPFGSRALARGARIEVRLTRAGRIGRVLRYRMTSTAGAPSLDILCRPPGGRTRAC